MKKNKVLFVKPPDRFLDDEFVYQQLAPHYLQAYLREHEVDSDILVLFEEKDTLSEISDKDRVDLLEELKMLLVLDDSIAIESTFDIDVFSNYDIIAMSVMSPQAPDAYRLNEQLKLKYPHLITVIGGPHARYYLDSVKNLPDSLSYNFIVPNDGWEAMLEIALSKYSTCNDKRSVVISHEFKKILDIPPPTRPTVLMQRYNFDIAGVKSFHTITAVGCPFSCNFCESGREKLRKFSVDMIDDDLNTMANTHRKMNNEEKGVMIFDDVGLMNPKQADVLAQLIKKNGFDKWRAFSHAFLVDRYGAELLEPFYKTGGRRIGLGLETGSQRSLDLLNKRNGQKQSIEEHYSAVEKANSLGIAIDAFTMIYPWENEYDLSETLKLIKFVANNKVKGTDSRGRPLLNNVDSTIMTPYQGTVFSDMLMLGNIPGVKIKNNIDPGLLFYKGMGGGSGWPYEKTVLPKERYEEAQIERNLLKAKYR